MLGKLKKIELREGWNHEANDFTVWLAKEENLELLSNEVGFDISLIQTEAKVGNFHVDILAEETDTGEKIVIENQLESTNHDHLGKIITYASGHNAKALIWIVKDAREEHRQAIDWLNDNTNEELDFYLIRIELWQIENSPPAPKFVIISKPNSWAKTIKSISENAKYSETKLKQQEFWQLFKEYATSNNTVLRLRNARPEHWFNISIGSSEYQISLTINSRDNMFGCELHIIDNKDLYHSLHSKKEKINSEIGEKIKWMELPDKKASRIKVSKNGSFEDKEQWEKIFEWMKNTGEKFKTVFPKYL